MNTAELKGAESLGASRAPVPTLLVIAGGAQAVGAGV